MLQVVELTQDPFTNTSDKFYLVISIQKLPTPNPGAVGSGSYANGFLNDPQGNNISYFGYYTYFVNEISSEPYSLSFTFKSKVLIPPGYSFSAYGRALTLYGTLEELRGYI